MIDRLRWGVLGTARILRRFLPALARSMRSELAAIASRDPERARACAARYACPRTHASYQALLDDPAIDAVYIPLPNDQHAAWTVRALRAGKHVLCEKPIALSVKEVDEIAEAARASGRHALEGYVHLHTPQLEALVAALPGIGPLAIVRGGMSIPIAAPNIRLDPARGGGGLWDVGCYPVSLMVRLIGSRPVSVSATMRRLSTGVDGALVGHLHFATNAQEVLGVIDCGLGTPLREHFEIVGARGMIIPQSPFRAGIDGSPSSLTMRVDGEELRAIEGSPPDPFAAELDAFERTALDGTPARVPLALSRDVTATLVALHESAASGRSVALAPPVVDR